MKTATGVIIGAVIVVIVILGVLSYQKNQKPDNAGSLYIGVTDATATMDDVTDVSLSVKKVEVYSTAKGWMTVSSNDKLYKLFALNASGKTELYAKTDVSAGTYDKVRVTLGDAVVSTKSKGDVKATLPSSYVVIDTSVKVKEGKNTHLKLDVLADKSLHATVDGGFVFAPVVKSESRSDADVTVDSSNVVSVSGGTVDASANVGVDIDGTSKADFELLTDTSLQVQSSVGGSVKFLMSGKTYEKNDASSESSLDAKSSTKVKAGADTKSGYGNGSMNLDLNGGIKVGQ
jgi:hypothetical protein